MVLFVGIFKKEITWLYLHLVETRGTKYNSIYEIENQQNYELARKPEIYEIQKSVCKSRGKVCSVYPRSPIMKRIFCKYSKGLTCVVWAVVGSRGVGFVSNEGRRGSVCWHGSTLCFVSHYERYFLIVVKSMRVVIKGGGWGRGGVFLVGRMFFERMSKSIYGVLLIVFWSF